MTLWKRQNYEDSKMVSGRQVLEGGTGEQASTEDLRAVKLLCDTMMADTCMLLYICQNPKNVQCQE